jgi:hypothetical protein
MRKVPGGLMAGELFRKLHYIDSELPRPLFQCVRLLAQNRP